MQLYLSANQPPSGTGDNAFVCARDLTTTENNLMLIWNGNTKTITTVSGWFTLTNAMVAAGAVSLVTQTTTIATSGAIALTLADGTVGQLKLISMITDGGDATLTPANMQGGTTITFNDVGDTVLLLFVGTKWAIVANTGATVA